MNNECCAHSIVKLSAVHIGGGAIKDAWHCCDCGLRFMPDSSLPQFVPEKSHLHEKLESCIEDTVRECAQFIFVLDAEPVSHKSAARMLLDHFGIKS